MLFTTVRGKEPPPGEPVQEPADPEAAREAKDRARIKKLFDKLDKNHDGRVDVEEIAQKLESLAQNSTGDRKTPDRERLLALAKDLVTGASASRGKGDEAPSLSLEEFTAFVRARERTLKALFSKIDADSDEHLTPQEMAAWLEEAHIKLSPEQLKRFMDELDTDHSRTIEWSEFRSFAIFIPPRRSGGLTPREFLVFHSAVFGQAAAGDQYEMGYVVPPQASEASELSTGRTVQYVLCGGLSAAVSRTATAPLDRIRVYFQNETSRLHIPGSRGAKGAVAAPQPLFQQLRVAIRDIMREGGIRSFYRGLNLELLKMIPGSAFQFTAFEISKAAIASLEGKSNRSQISDVGRFFAGGLAGATAMTAGYPLSSVKTRVMSDIVTESAAQASKMGPTSSGPVAAIAGKPQMNSHLAWRTAKDMYERFGIRGFYKGLPVALLGIVPYSGVNLALFELLRKEYVRRIEAIPSNMTVLVMGSISAGAGSFLVYPIQLVRTRLQAQGTPSHPYTYRNGLDVVKRTLAREGIFGLYRGIIASGLKLLPSAAITRLVFESSKSWFGLT
ncbi:mitochondrial carrier domain-containing protein [Hyaloraphidium curvatum]|nr:mitochondrial carrier domain-containing protein [Hyaloraphidium curvatum]